MWCSVIQCGRGPHQGAVSKSEFVALRWVVTLWRFSFASSTVMIDDRQGQHLGGRLVCLFFSWDILFWNGKGLWAWAGMCGRRHGRRVFAGRVLINLGLCVWLSDNECMRFSRQVSVLVYSCRFKVLKMEFIASSCGE